MCELNIPKPSDFLYLSLLADILKQDTDELESDFKIKMEFVCKQEKKCLENAEDVNIIDKSSFNKFKFQHMLYNHQLFSLDQFLGSFQSSLLRLEMELNDNELLLIEAENAVCQLERTCVNVPDRKPCRMYPLARSSYAELLGLLMSTENSTAQCNTLREEIEVFNKEASEQVAPMNVIAKIIDYHNKTLVTLDKQLEQLQCQVGKVQHEYDQIDKE
ncbi:hypothetical protein KR009_007409, partial [Drosophila setifemur]